MEFEELVETFGVLRKLHTSTVHNDKTIFYRDMNTRKGVMSITNFDGQVDNFKLELISHMSLSSWDGLLVQYDTLNGRKMFPYRLMNIRNVEIKFIK